MEEKQSLESIILLRILESPEFAEFIDQRAEAMYQKMKTEQKLTYEDIADEWQLSLTTVKTLTGEQLSGMGLKKIKGGAWVRFQRIVNIGASKEKYRKIKGGIKIKNQS